MNDPKPPRNKDDLFTITRRDLILGILLGLLICVILYVVLSLIPGPYFSFASSAPLR